MQNEPKTINPANVMFLVESNINLRIFYRSEDTKEDAVTISRLLDTDPRNVRLVDWECDFLSKDFGFQRCFEIHTQVFHTSLFLQELYFRQMLGKAIFRSVEDTQELISSENNFIKKIASNRDSVTSIAIKLSGDSFFLRPYAIIKYIPADSNEEINMVLTFSGVEDRALNELKKFGKMLSMERQLKLQENGLIVPTPDKSFIIY